MNQIRVACAAGQESLPEPRVVTSEEVELRRRVTVLQSDVADLQRRLSRLETESAALRESDRRVNERLARLERLVTSAGRGEG